MSRSITVSIEKLHSFQCNSHWKEGTSALVFKFNTVGIQVTLMLSKLITKNIERLHE